MYCQNYIIYVEIFVGILFRVKAGSVNFSHFCEYIACLILRPVVLICFEILF